MSSLENIVKKFSADLTNKRGDIEENKKRKFYEWRKKETKSRDEKSLCLLVEVANVESWIVPVPKLLLVLTG